MFESFDENHHFSNVHFLVTILFFFMIEIQAYWIQSYFNLTNIIFTKKDIVQE